MRTVLTEQISEVVAHLCVEANGRMSDDMLCCLKKASAHETSKLGRQIFRDIEENLRAADEMQIPICQDTGMAIVFADIGQDVHLEGALLEDAVNAGVSKGYRKGYLRFSVVRDPLFRENTGNNTPAVLHTRIVKGNKVKITVAPKGFGSENMSAVRMFDPSASRDDLLDFVVSVVKSAGSKPCPPIAVGVGFGGSFELCALLSKRALIRSAEQRHPDSFWADFERDTLKKINETGIGPQGLGGSVTALFVNVETFPTHIAGLPAAVNIGCHVNRHATETI